MDALEFLKLMREKMKLVQIDQSFSIVRSTKAFPAARRSALKFSRWRCWNRNWRFSTKPIPALTSTRCASWPMASIAAQ